MAQHVLSSYFVAKHFLVDGVNNTACRHSVAVALQALAIGELGWLRTRPQDAGISM
jgi:hypothetical protein